MNKKELRKKYKDLRAQLSPEQRDTLSIEIANQVLKLNLWDYDYYHIFLPIQRLFEVQTAYILSILSGKDKNIVLSKSDFKQMTMQHFLLTDSTKIVTNTYGISEPQTGIQVPVDMIDVVFIPQLACDTQGNRIGYGKGFYDRFLAACKPNIVKVGLSFFEPETTVIPTNHQDIRLDYCVLPSKIVTF